jgi:hypothetical protein
LTQLLAATLTTINHRKPDSWHIEASEVAACYFATMIGSDRMRSAEQSTQAAPDRNSNPITGSGGRREADI